MELEARASVLRPYVISDTWFLLGKYVKMTIRMPMWAFFTVIQPLIWLIIFGQLFQNMARLPGFPSGSYIDFFAPGAIIMTVLFGSSWSGISLLRELNYGVVDKMLVTPISRVSIVLSRVLHSTLTVLLQCIIIIMIAVLMGTHIERGMTGISLTMLVVFLLAICFSGISNGLAIWLKKEEPLVVMGNMLTLPLMFISSAMVPRDYLPVWIKTLSLINPIDYAVNAIRAQFSGQIDIEIFIKDIAILLAFAIIAITTATYLFLRKKEG